jgi:uncharacterized protein YndB with AHSA1/START domain
MEAIDLTPITVQATINSPIEKVWEFWTLPKHIIKWNNASDDWHTTRSENDLRTGGKFHSRMEAKDGSMGFDFEGIYEVVNPNELIEYSMSDGRKVRIEFYSFNDETTVVETFDPEALNPVDMQRTGWQMILDNFKKYTELI